MPYRNIVVTGTASLSAKNYQLIIDKKDNKISQPIEDISALMIESRYVSISSYALSQLAEFGVPVFFCNNEHIPNSVLLSYNNHSRQLKMTRLQCSLSKPLLNRLWQKIVVSKIVNQSLCLAMCNIEGAKKIKHLSTRVQSADKTNVEGVAAASYFKMLFGNSFTRSQDNVINAALNYGYSIIRGVVARNLVSYGLDPALGIHHRSELNNFNLADDIIEPFRQVVDLYVALNVSEDDELSPDLKYQLFGLLSVNVLIGEENYSVSYAIEKTVQSLSSCFVNNKEDILLPTLCELKLHQYE